MVDTIEAASKQVDEQPRATLFKAIALILFMADPIGINFDTNTDEYEPEASTIIPRLPSATSEDGTLKIVHEEICKWFDAETAGPAEAYRAVASEIWTAWQFHQSNAEPSDA